MTVSGSEKARLVAIDIDYTLIGSDLKISDRTKQAIHAATDAGSTVTLATGRMFRAAVPFAEELGLDAPLITYDGALVKTAKTEELYWHKPIPIEDAREILAHLQSLGFHINVYIDDEVYVERLNEESRSYTAHVNVAARAVGDLLEFLNEPPTKILMMTEPDVIDNLLPELERKFRDISHVVRSLPQYVEFTAKDVTKGAALAELAKRMGIPQAQVMAIGDSENDVTMLSYAGIGVAVCNAVDRAKEAADYVTEGINGDGVREAIYRFVLNS